MQQWHADRSAESTANTTLTNSENTMKLQYMAPLALLTLTSAAFADGFYGVGEVTHSIVSLDRSHFDNALGANGAAGVASSQNGNGNQWRVQGGYRFNGNLAVELGYIDFGKAKYSASYAGGTASGTVKAGGVDIAGLYFVPLTDQFSLFGKAGLVDAKVSSTLTASAPAALASGSTSTNVIKPLLGLGATYKLTEALDLRTDFDHVSGLGKAGNTGTMKDNMFSVGVSFKF